MLDCFLLFTSFQNKEMVSKHPPMMTKWPSSFLYPDEIMVLNIFDVWGLNEIIAVECGVQHWMKRELCFCLACLCAVMTCQVSTIGKSQFLKVNPPPSNLLNWWTYWGMLFNNRKDWATSRGKSMNDSQSHVHFEARHKRPHAMWFPLYSFPVVVQSISHIQLFVTPWTATCQAPRPSLSRRVCSNSCLLSQWCCLSNSV